MGRDLRPRLPRKWSRSRWASSILLVDPATSSMPMQPHPLPAAGRPWPRSPIVFVAWPRCRRSDEAVHRIGMSSQPRPWPLAARCRPPRERPGTPSSSIHQRVAQRRTASWQLGPPGGHDGRLPVPRRRASRRSAPASSEGPAGRRASRGSPQGARPACPADVTKASSCWRRLPSADPLPAGGPKTQSSPSLACAARPRSPPAWTTPSRSPPPTVLDLKIFIERLFVLSARA